MLRPFSPDDQTGHSEIWVRVQDRDLYLESIHPLLDERAAAAGLQVEIRFRDDDSLMSVGTGEQLRLEIDISDLCSLVYNGRRLGGLVEENGLSISCGDGARLPSIFPDTGATRCAQDAY